MSIARKKSIIHHPGEYLTPKLLGVVEMFNQQCSQPIRLVLEYPEESSI
jgi:hypothetical protein